MRRLTQRYNNIHITFTRLYICIHVYVYHTTHIYSECIHSTYVYRCIEQYIPLLCYIFLDCIFTTAGEVVYLCGLCGYIHVCIYYYACRNWVRIQLWCWENLLIMMCDMALFHSRYKTWFSVWGVAMVSYWIGLKFQNLFSIEMCSHNICLKLIKKNHLFYIGESKLQHFFFS